MLGTWEREEEMRDVCVCVCVVCVLCDVGARSVREFRSPVSKRLIHQFAVECLDPADDACLCHLEARAVW